ncbi:hypothetical protein C8F01DRAFT_1243753 [Mycena amicta]|nr:hypothetical protein C8F01DRAFT_1243753 [Mycena amicta]
MVQCDPMTMAEYAELHDKSYNLSLKKEERELAAWSRACRGCARPEGVDSDDLEEMQNPWFDHFLAFFAQDLARDECVQLLATRKERRDQSQDLDDFDYLLKLDAMAKKHAKVTSTGVLFNHIVNATIAIEFAFEHSKRSPTQIIEFTKRRFVADEEHSAAFKDIKHDHEACFERIDKQLQGKYILWKGRVHEKDIKARNCVYFAYKNLGPQILLDPAFSPEHLRHTSASYPHFVKKVVESLPQSVDSEFTANWTATLGIINALGEALYDYVVAVMRAVPSDPHQKNLPRRRFVRD